MIIVDRRRISSGLVNSRARHPSTKILRCFSPVLVYTSFEHVLFPRCVPLAPASPPVRCPLPTPSRGRAFNPSATLFTHTLSHPLLPIHGSLHTRWSRSSRMNVNRPKSTRSKIFFLLSTHLSKFSSANRIVDFYSLWLLEPSDMYLYIWSQIMGQIRDRILNITLWHGISFFS